MPVLLHQQHAPGFLAERCIVGRETSIEPDGQKLVLPVCKLDQPGGIVQIVGEGLVDHHRNTSQEEGLDKRRMGLSRCVNECGIVGSGRERFIQSVVRMLDAILRAEIFQRFPAARRQMNLELGHGGKHREICFARDVSQPDHQHPHLLSSTLAALPAIAGDPQIASPFFTPAPGMASLTVATKMSPIEA